jgi:hypothetical protein
MDMTEREYQSYCNDFAGYCTGCDDITEFSGVEPDAREYECPKCEKKTLYGIEEALMMLQLDIVEETEAED